VHKKHPKGVGIESIFVYDVIYGPEVSRQPCL